MTLSGYAIEGELLADGEIVIERGRAPDGAPVLIKRARSEYPSPREIARLRNEHAITRELDLPGVIRVRELVRAGGGIALVLDDPGGRPLADALLGGCLGLAEALRVASSLAGTLAAVHRRGIVHRDVCPRNVLIDIEAGSVRLTGFALAARLPGGLQRPEDADGSLAYMAPEQTGRTGRPVDERADLYALGVTLYEMLTGALPFPAADPVELVYAHLARAPATPREIAPAVPEAVSAIVMKLLEKAAEDRYRSAAGLEADLGECLRRLDEGAPLTAFPLGRREAPGGLRLPPGLYGREEQFAALLEAWGRARDGAVELALVEGPVGSGRSALLDEVRAAIQQGGGYSVAGRFQEPGRGAPGEALFDALRELCRHLLTEPAPVLERACDALAVGLGPGAGALAEVLPELTLLLDVPPPAQDVAPDAAWHRLGLAFQTFARIFTAGPRPLAICLDDLGWADAASLDLLSALATAAEGGRLLVIGATGGAAGDAPPAVVQAFRAAGATISTVALPPLDLPAVTRMIAGALGCDEARAAPLAGVCLERTGGGPLALRQLLQALHDDGLIAFAAETGAYAWDLDRIREAAFSADPRALAAARLRRLTPAAQRALGLAAVVGRRFDLTALARLDGRPEAEIASDLGDALRTGLVAPAGAEPLALAYAFSHERVHQAASELLDEADRRAAHLALARRLLAGGSPPRGDEALFEAARHACLGAPLIEDLAERIDVARVELAAGRRARARGSIDTAAGYLAAGIAALGDEGWEAAYDLSVALHLTLGACEHLSGDAAAAEARFDAVLARARSELDRARVDSAKVTLYSMAGRHLDAVAAGRRGLLRLGIDIGDTEEAHQRVLRTALGELEMTVISLPIESLQDAPLMTAPAHRLALELLVNLHAPALTASAALLATVVYLQVNLSLQHGHSELSAYGYMAYARMLARASRRYPEAYAFGKLALDLDARLNGGGLRCRLSYFFGTFLHLMEPLRTVLPYLTQAIDAGLESGDLQYASFACCHALAILLALGDDLGEVEEQAARFAAIVARSRNASAGPVLAAARQAIKNLTGATFERRSLSDAAFDEASFAAALDASEASIAKGFYHTIKLQLLFLHGDHEGALREARLAEAHEASIQGAHFATELSFYAALAAAAVEPVRSPMDPPRSVAADSARGAATRSRRPAPPGEHARRVEAWADDCPASFRHKHLLIQAERARVSGDEIEAMARYDEAIEAARDNEFPRDEALANELCARFHLARGRRKVARVYMTDAYYGYARWGATAKADDIARDHPDLLLRTGPAPLADARRAGFAERAELLDVATVIRASRALAEEGLLDRVLAQLMRIVVESAGAQRGVLLLDRDGSLTVEASIEASTGAVEQGRPVAAEESAEIPLSIVQYVARTQTPVVLGNAAHSGRFSGDPYIAGSEPRSVLCVPLTHQGGVSGILYLENNAARDAFSPARIELLRVISSQAAIAIRNALLYARVRAATDEILLANERLEAEVARRTEELSEANRMLAGELARRAEAERERAALQEEVIRVQRARLAELSTPLLPITDRVMVMPLMGEMNAERAMAVLETALAGARANRALIMIIDVTGVKGVDTGVAGMLVRTAGALRILGTEAVITGIRPEVARMIIGLGLDLGDIATLSTLQRGIAYALERTEGDLGALRSGWNVLRARPTA
ncbi:MAG: AAA family ATPase [Polyangiaceae bacterium]|nr:AAA family ATPase [Polyangiaceae bacterium]